MKKENLLNKIFGDWKVIKSAPQTKSKHTRWLCQCKCGKTAEVYAVHLKSGNSKSCFECSSKTHGMIKSKEYSSWRSMKARVLNKNHKAYHRYGGRGITICDRWFDFENFYQDMGNAPIGYTLDRIDNNGNYEPANCKWSSYKEQGANRSNNIYVIVDEIKMTMSQASEYLGISYNTLYGRFKKNNAI